MGHLKFMGHDLDPNKTHVNIKIRFETGGLLPFFITGQKGKCFIRIENVGEREIPKTDFRWEIFSEKSKITGDPIIKFFDISEVELMNTRDFTEREFEFTPEISGQHRLSIFVIDKEKNKKIGFHSGIEHFEGNYYRFFESYSWYLIVGGIGTILIGILTVLEILQILIPFLLKFV